MDIQIYNFPEVGTPTFRAVGRPTLTTSVDLVERFWTPGACEMTREEIEALVKTEEGKVLEARDAVAAQVAEKVSPWHKKDWEAMTAAGVFDGTRPGAGMTREQAATVFMRLGLSERGV